MAAQDQAHDLATAMIDGVVTAALEADVPETTINAAVRRAIVRHGGGSSTDELLEELRVAVEGLGGRGGGG